MAVPMSAATLSTQSLSELARAPASDVKKLGWRGVMRTVNSRLGQGSGLAMTRSW